ncbi:MAG TPA: sialidase family protein [Candidatus Saccharimonadales bacterium]
MKTIKKLNQTGFAHWILPVLVMAVVALIGVKVLTGSHADQVTPSTTATANTNLLGSKSWVVTQIFQPGIVHSFGNNDQAIGFQALTLLNHKIGLFYEDNTKHDLYEITSSDGSTWSKPVNVFSNPCTAAIYYLHPNQIPDWNFSMGIDAKGYPVLYYNAYSDSTGVTPGIVEIRMDSPYTNFNQAYAHKTFTKFPIPGSMNPYYVGEGGIYAPYGNGFTLYYANDGTFQATYYNKAWTGTVADTVLKGLRPKSVLSAGNGKMVMVGNYPGGTGQPWSSTYNGSTWSPPVQVDKTGSDNGITEYGDPQLVRLGGSKFAVMYMERSRVTGPSTYLYFSTSSDSGASWSASSYTDQSTSYTHLEDNFTAATIPNSNNGVAAFYINDFATSTGTLKGGLHQTPGDTGLYEINTRP